MDWTITEDLERYLGEAGEFLRADPVGNTVLLSVAETLRMRGGDAYGNAARFGWWRDESGVRGAFQQTSPHPVFLSSMPELAARSLAVALASYPVSGVNGEPGVVEAFTSAWAGRGEVAMRQRLYRLARLVPPEPFPPGTSRVATFADRDLVLAWFQGFQDEAHGAGSANPSLVSDKIEYGGVVLWEVDGVPVSMASRTRIMAGMARVAPVYTPPSQRRRGYGAAACSVLTRSALDAGAREVVLFTDLANPTSNGIYQRLGFAAVGDRLVVSFP
jgi:predicted GNAT family acetyltransferase